MIAYTGSIGPVRSYEGLLEATYSAQIVPGWTLQPNVQFVFHPGGGAPDPFNPARSLRNAAIFGVRTTIKF